MLLGKGKWQLARQVSNLVLTMSALFMWINATAIIVFRVWLFNIWFAPIDRTPELVEIGINVLVITGAASFVDGIQVVGGSIVRSTGKPEAGAVILIKRQGLLGELVGAESMDRAYANEKGRALWPAPVQVDGGFTRRVRAPARGTASGP